MLPLPGRPTTPPAPAPTRLLLQLPPPPLRAASASTDVARAAASLSWASAAAPANATAEAKRLGSGGGAARIGGVGGATAPSRRARARTASAAGIRPADNLAALAIRAVSSPLLARRAFPMTRFRDPPGRTPEPARARIEKTPRWPIGKKYRTPSGPLPEETAALAHCATGIRADSPTDPAGLSRARLAPHPTSAGLTCGPRRRQRRTAGAEACCGTAGPPPPLVLRAALRHAGPPPPSRRGGRRGRQGLGLPAAASRLLPTPRLLLPFRLLQ